MLKSFVAPAVVAASVAAYALPAKADQISLDALSDYLNDMGTVQANFTQISDDGSVQTGKLFIKRPGMMRFEYNPPDKALVLTFNNSVAIFDGRSNQPPEVYPLKRTPLSIILDKDVNLGQANMVVGHDYDGTATVVTAQDPQNPDIGSIQLKFTADPVELRQWVINDNTGSQTTVILGDTKSGMPLGNRIFDIDRERRGAN
ncbi:Outer-membrane lipoprotein carrier protein precursor [Shimia sp. SK013]|uniref:LolA family protein n=1 Tax=Shimia sp. SK013 TaxID=1389006 RepID=UPI0006B5695A|nr:outer membrane lipoprotein carrier protein LolA [Shimia sp. SK013]KPA21172.1 Outer-membrane lipoprotein carrier protein precursor [Shimia sp. SK013]